MKTTTNTGFIQSFFVVWHLIFQESHQGESKLPPRRHLGCEGDMFWLTTLRYSEND